MLRCGADQQPIEPGLNQILDLALHFTDGSREYKAQRNDYFDILGVIFIQKG